MFDLQTKQCFKNLTLIFVGWKSLIAIIALLSPGPGYDTSSDLLAVSRSIPTEIQNVSESISHNVLKLVRWDAIYYTEMARNGHVHEQRWAFGMGTSTVLASVAQTLKLDNNESIMGYAIAGILVSHISHWLSVMLLYLIAKDMCEPKVPRSSSIPFVAAVLHIISPGGIFLSAPYSESLFSFLNMFGFLCYIKSVQELASGSTAAGLMIKLLSGAAFGLAATVRGNGVLSGIPFFLDAVETSLQILSPRVGNFERSQLLLQLQFTILSGCFVAVGVVYPQFIAYKEYCWRGSGRRPWCESKLPSIFSFVQSHYWNVGFLRYWTLSNAPLFLLAVPCLYLLIVSGYQNCRPAISSRALPSQKVRLRIALPQLVLALLALTNYHVQIITRLSSGYPIWYIWLATRIQDWKHSNAVVRTLALYALIQAGLFASFLPPA